MEGVGQEGKAKAADSQQDGGEGGVMPREMGSWQHSYEVTRETAFRENELDSSYIQGTEPAVVTEQPNGALSRVQGTMEQGSEVLEMSEAAHNGQASQIQMESNGIRSNGIHSSVQETDQGPEIQVLKSSGTSQTGQTGQTGVDSVMKLESERRKNEFRVSIEVEEDVHITESNINTNAM